MLLGDACVFHAAPFPLGSVVLVELFLVGFVVPWRGLGLWWSRVVGWRCAVVRRGLWWDVRLGCGGGGWCVEGWGWGGGVWLWLWVIVVESDADSDLTFVVHEVDDVVVVVVGGDVVLDVSFPPNDRPCVSSSHEVGV